MGMAGENTILAIEDPENPGDWIDITEVVDITPPSGMSVPVVNTTVLSSEKGTSRPGRIPKPGTFACTLRVDRNNPTHQILFDMWDNPPYEDELPFWRITYNTRHDNKPTDVFQGYVTDIDESGAEDESDVMSDVSFAISGGIVRTEGTDNGV